MPETIENVETTEQVEVQDTTNNGYISLLVAGAICTGLFIAGRKLAKFAWDGLKEHKAKREREKMTVVDDDKNQDNSKANGDVKDKTK